MTNPTARENVANALQLCMSYEYTQRLEPPTYESVNHLYANALHDLKAIRRRLEAALKQLDGAAQLDGRTP